MMTKKLAEQCAWSDGCCNIALDGRAYCEEHLWKVYQKGTALGKRKKDAKRARAVWDVESEINAAVQELIDEGNLDL